ncbi:hypothetical protein PR048_000330 [Dryococelus australis]|uniref:Retrotransposon gag domain-containing protein n=1 Tax=Dryococelus australis TaxID=614101 RepID=A0ABQ9IEH3_9NEOP|nr:hypothetical protein PR048_000330 [Dryococelus australis]
MDSLSDNVVKHTDLAQITEQVRGQVEADLRSLGQHVEHCFSPFERARSGVEKQSEKRMNKLADNLSHVETEVGNLRSTVDGMTVSAGDLSVRGEPSVEQPRRSVATAVLQTLPDNNAERQSHSCTASYPAGTFMHHPSNLWVEQVPKFEGRYGENPINFLKRSEEYASVFGLPDANMLRCLSLSFRNTAYYWREMNKSTVHIYSEFKEKCTDHFWSKKIQGNLRVQLHSERFVPGKGKKLENHLAEMYVKSKYLDPPSQLPYNYYQSHWMGRHPEDLSTFREDHLAYGQIDRLQRMQNNSDQDRQIPLDRRPQYTDHTATGSRPPLRYGNNPHVRNTTATTGRMDGEINGEEEDATTAINSELSGDNGTDERDNKTDHEELKPHRADRDSANHNGRGVALQPS